MGNRKDKWCSFCGSGHDDPYGQVYPKVCSECDNITYRNPTPVAVALVPVFTNYDINMALAGSVGILVVRRNIEPKLGELSLPGGFIDFGETWQSALVRELMEETGLAFAADKVRLFDVKNTTSNILIFGSLPPIWEDDVPTSFSNDETQSVEMVCPIPELCFPTHTEAARAFIERPWLIPKRP